MDDTRAFSMSAVVELGLLPGTQVHFITGRIIRGNMAQIWELPSLAGFQNKSDLITDYFSVWLSR